MVFYNLFPLIVVLRLLFLVKYDRLFVIAFKSQCGIYKKKMSNGDMLESGHRVLSLSVGLSGSGWF